MLQRDGAYWLADIITSLQSVLDLWGDMKIKRFEIEYPGKEMSRVIDEYCQRVFGTQPDEKVKFVVRNDGLEG